MKMEASIVVLLCLLAAAAHAKPPTVTLHSDLISLRIAVSQTASLQCCYSSEADLNVNWTLTVMITHNDSVVMNVNQTDKRMHVVPESENNQGVKCSSLQIQNVSVKDRGLYRCALHHTNSSFSVHTPGTFLQVFEPMEKVLDISESWKNSIITAEGVLLLLCVLIPGTMLIFKSKGLHELERRKGKEEENIYEGLNLDDCNSTYHQIQRSQVQGPYHDVSNAVEEDIEFEKP
uniref:CD79a molecule, immunoglobulin-associated alpha n=1 Tax=Astyanax mexicanus TaxID=7994 RepID=A0A8B9H3Y8_ASTMX